MTEFWRKRKLTRQNVSLEFLVALDTIMHVLFTAPYDDEPDSEEERSQAKKAWEEYSQGNALSHEEVSREIFGE